MTQDALKPRPLVYVAGAMSHRTKAGWWANIERGKAVALRLMLLGFAVDCPHLSAHYETVPGYEGMDWTTWLSRDTTILRRCDAMFLVPGWESSKGANKELAVARRNAIPVFEDIDAMCEHFNIRIPVPA